MGGSGVSSEAPVTGTNSAGRTCTMVCACEVRGVRSAMQRIDSSDM